MNINKKEVLAIIDYLEKDKGIDREIAANIIKDSLASAIEKSKEIPGLEVYIDKNSGMFVISSIRKIVDEAIDKSQEITLEEVKKMVPTAQIGEYVRAAIDSSILRRSVAHKAWQILRKKIEDKSLEALYKEYQQNYGNIVKGFVVKKIGTRSLLVDIGRMSVMLHHSNYPFNEHYREGDRVSAVIIEEDCISEKEDRFTKKTTSIATDPVNPNKRIALSRNCDEFIYGILASEISEIGNDIIRIWGIERVPGLKCKVVAQSTDPNVDVIGSCVGNRGARITKISEDLQNERIEIIPYSPDEDEMISNIFSKVCIIHILKHADGEREKIDIVTDDDSFPAAVGKSGINVKLVNKILNKHVVLHRETAFNLMLEELKEKILEDSSDNIDAELEKDILGGMLVNHIKSKGFLTYRSILEKSIDEIKEIEGVNAGVLYKILLHLKGRSQEEFESSNKSF